MTTNEYRIKDSMGRFWNGTGFGPVQAAAVYNSTADLPYYLGELEREDFTGSDIRWFEDGILDAEASLETREVETTSRILFDEEDGEEFRAAFRALVKEIGLDIEFYDDPAVCASAGGETEDAADLYGELCEMGS